MPNLGMLIPLFVLKNKSPHNMIYLMAWTVVAARAECAVQGSVVARLREWLIEMYSRYCTLAAKLALAAGCIGVALGKLLKRSDPRAS